MEVAGREGFQGSAPYRPLFAAQRVPERCFFAGSVFPVALKFGSLRPECGWRRMEVDRRERAKDEQDLSSLLLPGASDTEEVLAQNDGPFSTEVVLRSPAPPDGDEHALQDDRAGTPGAASSDQGPA